MMDKSNILKMFCFVVGTIIGVVLVWFLLGGINKNVNKRVYVSSDVLDDIVNTIGLYDDDLNEIFINADYSSNDYKELAVVYRVAGVADKTENDIENNVLKYYISDKKLELLADQYGINNYKDTFKNYNIKCEVDPNAESISNVECGEGWLKYYEISKSTLPISSGLFPEYEHNFEIYSGDRDEVIVKDKVKVTLMPTGEVHKHRLFYTFDKTTNGYYLKNVTTEE